MLEKQIESHADNILVGQEVNFNDDENFAEKNFASVCGVLEKDFEFSHHIYGEKFYENRIKIKRLSGIEDFIPIIVSEVLIQDFLKAPLTRYVKASGEFRSYNRYGEDGKNHLDLFLFIKSIDFYKEEDNFELDSNLNKIHLNGFICKEPVYRETPNGKEITDFIIAVNRKYNKSDYIHCIAWGVKQGM